jgi:hypothetical protein
MDAVPGDLRYIIGSGLMLADDYFTKMLTPTQLERIDMTGAWIIRLKKPRPCLFVMFGAAGMFLPNAPCCKYACTPQSVSEQLAIGRFMADINPQRVQNLLRVTCYHIDIVAAEGHVVRRPTTEEVARMDLKARGLPQDDGRVSREIRALGRRQSGDANKKMKKKRQKISVQEEKEIAKDLFGSDGEGSETAEVCQDGQEMDFLDSGSP